MVRQEDDGTTTLLERKRYRWWKFFGPCFVLPGILSFAGITQYLATGNHTTFLFISFFTLVITCILLAIYRVEWVQLHQQPERAFVWKSDGSIEVQGEIYSNQSSTGVTFEYTFYQPGSCPEGGAFSELEVVIDQGLHHRKVNLLAQKSNWALKHARKLHQLTQIPLKRTVVTK